jgi:plasmid stability protein
MSKMLQVRDLPDELHYALKARAAREGMSLSDFVKRELARTMDRPSMLEWLERTELAEPVATGRSAVEVVRELRDAR